MQPEPRECGVLLHPTSLPAPYGIGDLGPDAFRFVDALAAMGQRVWQMLPLGPTGYGDSPYQTLSTFAGNPLLISPDQLVDDGLLDARRLKTLPAGDDPAAVDYGAVIDSRRTLLSSVCRTFARRASPVLKKSFERFCRQESDWLDDFALFRALKHAYDEQPWTTWPPELALRDPAALAVARKQHRTGLRHEKIVQFLFAQQWQALRRYAGSRGVELMGDLPIFVAHDSADVWAHPRLFDLNPDGSPRVIAGVPPDYFSATGQRWGNPLYRWEEHQADGYAWWVRRMAKAFALLDRVRIDHFRGFEAYWEIPAAEPTAIHGRWVPGPGAALFDRLHEALGPLPVVAEDLGVITPPVLALRDRYGFPGMRILQFSFGPDAQSADDRPDRFPVRCVVYTGTHDNDTTVGWFHGDPGGDHTRAPDQVAQERRAVLDYVGTDGREIHWDLIGVACRTPAHIALFPLQDVLGLGSEARMNVPGRPDGNWRWRFQWDKLTDATMARLRTLAQETGRLNGN